MTKDVLNCKLCTLAGIRQQEQFIDSTGKGNRTQDPPIRAPPNPTSADFPSDSGWEKRILTMEIWFLFSKGVKLVEVAVGAIFAPTRCSLERISSRGLVADGNP